MHKCIAHLNSINYASMIVVGYHICIEQCTYIRLAPQCECCLHDILQISMQFDRSNVKETLPKVQNKFGI